MYAYKKEVELNCFSVYEKFFFIFLKIKQLLATYFFLYSVKGFYTWGNAGLWTLG